VEATEDAFDENQKLQGVRMLTRLDSLLERIADESTERDKAGNRELFFNHLCGLLLLTFFNPTVKSLRHIQQASRLTQVKKKLGCNEASLGSLSESLRRFEPERLTEIIQELLGQVPELRDADPRLKDLAHVPTAVDGTLLRQMPQITQACFDTRRDKGWKLHTHFEVQRGVPTFAQVTDGTNKGAAHEAMVLRKSLGKDRCYITDRGYESFVLFNEIVAAQSSYVCRVKNDHHFQVDATVELSAEAIEAGVVEEARGRMGSPKSKRITHPDHDQRRIVVRFEPHAKRGGRRRKAGTQELVLVTNLLDVPTEVIVALYRYRWLIELFFRWLKCVMSCRHLVSQSENGIQIQMYCALIACLLIHLAGGRDMKPTSWTYTLLCLYFQGMADEDEVLEHLRSRWMDAAKKIS
jgi:hypothetical protein